MPPLDKALYIGFVIVRYNGNEDEESFWDGNKWVFFFSEAMVFQDRKGMFVLEDIPMERSYSYYLAEAEARESIATCSCCSPTRFARRIQ